MSQIGRLFDIPYYQLQNYPLQKAFTTKYHGNWQSTSTQEYIDQANFVSKALLAMGIKKGDKIALITSTNRTEWNIMDIGILQTGAVTVPIYPTISEHDYEYIIKHSESLYVFVSDNEVLKKLDAVKFNIPKLRGIYSFDEIPGCANWQQVVTAGKEALNHQELETAKANVHPNDLASIIYTSGTTGTPKGVLLTHENIISNVLGSENRVPFEKGKYTALSFLPCCHIFERMILYLYQYLGVSIYFAESIDKISDNLQEVKPQVMTVVPRVLEKVFDKIYAKGSELSGIKKGLFFWALRLAENFKPYKANGAFYEFKLNIARKLIFSKWQAALGGNLELLVSGSAPLSPRLARIFGGADIAVMEGYGLTETSPVIAVNDARNFGWKIGSVGRVLDNVTVKIAEDGEILCQGPSISQGYFKDDEKTKEAFIDGWFHTGDIGMVDTDGFLFITDRKKEMFKTSGGKYVAPQMIENAMKQSRFIEQIMVVGEGQKMPAAIIQPSFDFIKEWANRNKVNVGFTLEEVVNNELVKERIQKEIETINPQFGKWEQIKKFALTPSVWSIDSGELTPTLKLKRKIILEKYKELYDKMYS
ncbi:long-chain fatty acid--CoA ligase [Flavobacterium sp. xlx-214]|uniref:AMP-dependent synthetase/ligase n=1 Tax=unclassified Flavobacterium TaxID=196869 RepID=UPI0013D516A6|nr:MULTISPECIES: long-chain fatty acid--CoA ligase [unclassified Flavobacterium]MBA5793176.1 long-chain fatty acid--CoA ligase [Flavobacterium sp. xlx-221]QMI82541.1 long-chain fatty acid--CoA ligase [Flavobacterium sp. xlx-214]